MQTKASKKSMDAQEFKVVVDAARAYEALTAQIREKVAAVQKACDQGGQAAIQELLAKRLLQPVRMADLLAKQMLAYAEAQTLAPASVELLPFLSDLTHLLLRTLDRRLFVFVEVGHDCPPCRADAPALHEALMNLIINARDALPDGGRIRLSAMPATAMDGRPAVAVSVSDNGVGMTPEFARRAVQPFVTTKVNAPYAGMGLAATDGFARQSGGHLDISCRVGSGVTATLVLPQAMPNASIRLEGGADSPIRETGP